MKKNTIKPSQLLGSLVTLTSLPLILAVILMLTNKLSYAPIISLLFIIGGILGILTSGLFALYIAYNFRLKK